MSRFSQPPDPLFRALHFSIGFDWRLGIYDVEQSRAHARMLHRAGLITRDEYLDSLSDLIEELQTTPGRLVRRRTSE